MDRDFDEYVAPVSGNAPVSAAGEARGAVPGGEPALSIEGRIVAVHRRTARHEEGHQLDITVGGEEHTELVVRIPSGPYSHLEGRKVLLIFEG